MQTCSISARREERREAMSDDSDDDDVEYEPETVSIGAFTFQILTVARMPVSVLMMNAAVGVEISGQKVWCGSVGVAQYLIESPSLVEGKLVVELGSGTGVLGMICKRLGAAKVVLTDHDDRSLSHMRHDVISNKVDADILRFDWYNPDMAGLIATTLSSTSASFASSSAPEMCREIVIVAGDVLYKRALLEPFFAATKLILDLSTQMPSKFSSSEMILCHIPRAENSHEMVVEAAISAGLSINEIARDESWRDMIRGSRCKFEDDDSDDATCPDHDINRAKLYSVKIKV